MIFLALPYRHRDPAVVEYRINLAKRVAAEMMVEAREPVLCLVAYGHDLVRDNGLADDLSFWDDFITTTLKASTKMVVLRLKGWDVSEGLLHEIKRANDLAVRIEYRDIQEEESLAVAS